MKKSARVQFLVDGFGEDASEVTRIMGIEPTDVPVCGFGSLPQQVSWVLELQEPIPEEISDHVTALVKWLRPREQALKSLSGRYKTRIAIVVDDRDYIYPEEPDGPRFATLAIPQEILASIASSGVGLSVHFWAGLET
jgi:hypothetical protein